MREFPTYGTKNTITELSFTAVRFPTWRHNGFTEFSIADDISKWILCILGQLEVDHLLDAKTGVVINPVEIIP